MRQCRRRAAIDKNPRGNQHPAPGPQPAGATEGTWVIGSQVKV